jgi:glucose/arabinose dehydrogenase
MKNSPLAHVRIAGVALYLIANFTLSGAQSVRPEVVASGLQHPWALAFLPEGRFLVSERMGALRVIEATGTVGEPIKGLPDVAVGGQGGLLDVLLDADFSRNRTLFFCYSEAGAGGNGTALARARLSADLARLEDFKVIFRQVPKVNSSAHFGCRMVESHTDGQPDGRLFLTLGERYHRKEDAQRLDNHLGKVVRINKDGEVPADNPFVGRPGALPEIWSYGHRNPQGATRAPDGTLWIHEHGPQGGDEINRPKAGQNYGWPVVTFGENYGGGKIGEGLTAKPGMVAPLHYWVPSIAPSGMTFLTSERYGRAWVGNLFVGSLKFGYLDRIELTQPFSGTVLKENRLLADVGERVRDVRQGPDGLLYVLTDQARGHLIRLLPSVAGF